LLARLGEAVKGREWIITKVGSDAASYSNIDRKLERCLVVVNQGG
jgi:hypothetical protein